jgi:hypothetical protein
LTIPVPAQECSASQPNGNAQTPQGMSGGICQLDQTLKCRSDIQPSDKFGHPIDMSDYAVSMQGVTAKGTFYPWSDANAASAIVNAVEAAAAQQAAKNKAVLDNMGGEENFKQLFTASI